MLKCSPSRPWGLHAPLRSDEHCPRCGWTAPGPTGDPLDAGFEAGPRGCATGSTLRPGAALAA